MPEWCNNEAVSVFVIALLVICLFLVLLKKQEVKINQTFNSPPQKKIIIKEVHHDKVTPPILFKIAIPVTVLSVSITLFSITLDLHCPNLPKKPAPQRKTYIYDTDPQNNAFIIQRLDSSQLEELDKLLMFEKATCGERLRKGDIKKYSKGQSAVENAYERWRKCKDLFRSSGSVIYPDERDHYKRTSN